MNLQVVCGILKRVTYLLDYAFYVLTSGGLFSLGAQDVKLGTLLFALAFACFAGSYELGYITSHMIIRIELIKNQEAKDAST